MANSRRYKYNYPNGLNLLPGSELHEFLIPKILQRAQESHNMMKRRFDAWTRVDRNLTAYVPLSEAEKDIKSEDDRKPVSVVVPLSYGVLDTLLTYWMSAFLEEPFFRYEGFAPEDRVGAIMLEKIIQLHCSRLKVGLQLYKMWYDAFKYGIGIVSPIWHKHIGRKTIIKDNGILGSIGGLFGGPRRLERSSEEAVLFEGNKLVNIDPYKYLPDPNVPIDDPQRGEFVGWSDRDTLVGLLKREVGNPTLFNVRYLQHIPGISTLYGKDHSSREDKYGGTSIQDTAIATKPVDVTYFYIDLIPQNWNLGRRTYPEQWLFGIAADQVIISCQPTGLNHGMKPVAVCAPTSDGYTTAPVSVMEMIYPLQEFTDWGVSSHIANVRKAMNDMFVVDPSIINIHDLRRPGPGKLIRTRRAAWGQSVKDAVVQLQVNDVTRGNMSDMGTMIDVMNRVMGTSDAMQGVMRHTSERKSATEARGAMGGATSRLAKGARVASMQAMYDIAYMFASHTQQLMSNDLYVKTTGRWEEVLRDEYNISGNVSVSPLDIVVDYDVMPRDGSVPSGEFADVWLQLYSMAAGNPEIAEQLDLMRVFKHIARLLGAKNEEDFMKKGGVQPSVRRDA